MDRLPGGEPDVALAFEHRGALRDRAGLQIGVGHGVVRPGIVRLQLDGAIGGAERIVIAPAELEREGQHREEIAGVGVGGLQAPASP